MPEQITIVSSDWFNALYRDGRLADQGKPDRLDCETLSRIYPHAQYYTMDNDVYDDVLDGAGYPELLSELPLSRMSSAGQ